MTRQLSFLSDATLSALLTIALRVARRLGCGYDARGMWQGPWMPNVVAEVVFEYRERNTKEKVKRVKCLM